jgi:hypothetical protein
MRKSLLAGFAAGAAALLAIPNWAAASVDEVFQQMGHTVIPGQPLVSFDISWVDQAVNDYFLADRSNKSIDIIPMIANPPVFQVIPTGVNAFAGPSSAAACASGSANDCAGPNGLITINNVTGSGQREIWVGDGPTVNAAACGSSTPCSTVKVFSIAGLTHTISTGGQFRADELCFDPVHHLVMIANDADSPPFVSFISTDTFKVVGKISFSHATNGIEQCQWNKFTQAFDLAIPAVDGTPGEDDAPGAVVTFTNNGGLVQIQQFSVPINACAGPQGLAILDNGDLLLGCNATSPGNGLQNTVIVEGANPSNVLHTFPGLGGNDEVWFDSASGHGFLAGGSHLPTEQLGILDIGPPEGINDQGTEPDQTIFVGFVGSTARRAHSVAAFHGVLPGSGLAQSLTIGILPVPAVGGTPAPASSTLCGDNAAAGCVSYFGSFTNDDDNI